MQNTECHNSSAMKISTFSTSRVLITNAVVSGRWMMEIELKGKLINEETNRKLSCGRQNCTYSRAVSLLQGCLFAKTFGEARPASLQSLFLSAGRPYFACSTEMRFAHVPNALFRLDLIYINFFFSLLSFVNSGGYRESIKLMFRPENRQRLR